MTNTKAAKALTAGDEIYYAPNTVTVTKITSNTAVVGFYYKDPNTNKSLYGWYDINDTVEMA